VADQEFGQLDVRYLNHAALGLPGGGELYYEDSGEGPVLMPPRLTGCQFHRGPGRGHFVQ
jgi:hypothetical protein